MALLDIFKKKKKPSFVKTTEGKEGEKEVKKEIKEVSKPREVAPPKTREKKSDLAWRVLRFPHISEKATGLAEKNQYVFRVWPKSNKAQIKKAIEDMYGVEVVGVKIINIPRKQRRLGRIRGWRGGYKKAIVKIKQGQKIEVLPR